MIEIDYGKQDNHKEFNALASKLVTQVLQKGFKIPNPRSPENTFTLENIKVIEPDDSPTEFMRKKTRNENMVMRVYGDVVEVDPKGKKVEVIEKKVFLGSIPYRTPTGTYLLGNDYAVTTQPRNLPGVYTNASGDGTAQSVFQLGKGRAFKVTLSDAGALRIVVDSKATPLVPLLLILGFTESELKDLLGKHLWTKNERWDQDKFYKSMGEAFFYNNPEYTNASPEDKDAKLKDYMLTKTSLDTSAMSALVGLPVGAVNKDLFKALLPKLLAVYRKDIPGDDRNDYRFSKMMTPSHLFADRLERQLTGITNAITQRVRRGKDVGNAARNLITKPLHATVLTSDLSRLDPQYNLMGAIITGNTVTSVGEGAISSVDMVEEKARQYHPTQTGIVDMTFTPQGTAVGLSLRAAPGLVVDEEGRPKIKLKDIRTGKVKPHTLHEAAKLTIIQPGESKKGMVKAFKDYQEVTVDFKQVTHEFSDFLFGDSMQMVPMPSGMQGPRGIMAVTQFAQAVPLKHREAPRVTVKDPKSGKATDEVLGKNYLGRLGLTSPVAGTIEKITPTQIVIRSTGGQKRVITTEEVMPLQYNTGVKITPKPDLKVGDKVKKDDALFVTNMHNDKGELAPGIHLKVGWLVDAEGYGVEDGIVISESAAEKLTSQHFYKIEVDLNPGEELNYKLVTTLFGHQYEAEQLANIDPESGVVKEGSTVHEGDVLACKVTKRELSEMDKVLGKLSRTLGSDWMNTSIIWDKFHHGKVVKIERSGRKYILVIETEEAAEVGSKLTGRYGNKGVVTKIRADADMPKLQSTGEALDIILSPASVPSRVNPAQVEEAGLGRTGKKYMLDHFDSERDLHSMTTSELGKKGYAVDGKERVVNPLTGTTNEVGFGEGYFLKLFSPEKSISARGIAGGYDGNLQPVKGGKEGSKALGLMEFYALLGHNSKELLKEFGTIKSEKNTNFWRNFELGLANMPKGQPHTFGKFSALMTAAGAQIQRTPAGLTLLPVTDKITSKLSEGRKIKKAVTVRGNQFDEIEQGLFDPKLTGGKKGELWTEYELADGIPHPLLDNIIRVILGKSKTEWPEFMSTAEGSTLKTMLDNVDIEAAKQRIRSDMQNNLDVSNNTQALRFLMNLKHFDAKLSDFIITKIPVIPPKHRPFTVMADGTKTVNDLNYLYMDVIQADQLYREVADSLPETKKEAKRNLTGSVRAFVGLEEPRSNVLKEKGVRGALNYITGVTTPKEGFFLNKMMKRQMIGTGRARIIPDPTANMDEVGIPEFIAWKQFEPHLRKELRGMGFAAHEVTELINKQDPKARRALDKVVKENYVLVNRAPTMHRFGILAGKPKIVDGIYVSIPTAFEAPLNADYDGDEATLHVPITQKGKEEARKMLLSNNPFTGYSPFDLTTGFDAEAIAGLFLKLKNNEKEFTTWWSENMPEDIPFIKPMDKKSVKKVLKELGKKYKGEEYAEYFGSLSRQGLRWGASEGLTMSMGDIKTLPGIETISKKYDKLLSKASDKQERAEVLGAYQKDVLGLINNPANKSSIVTMLTSGSKGSAVQASGVLGAPAAWRSPLTGEVAAVDGNTSKGYSFSEFYKMNAKARDEMIKTKLSVAAPGDLYKQMAFNTRQSVIVEDDCGTPNGKLVEPSSEDFNSDDLLGRYLAEEVAGFSRNTLITPDNVGDFMMLDKIKVRSPLTCATKRGKCAKCYGSDDEGVAPVIGDHINIRAINSFSMPISQKALDSKHSVRSFTGDQERKSLLEDVKGQVLGTSADEAPPVAGNEGTVIKVEQLENKSYIVVVDKKKYVVQYPMKPAVKIGDKVVIGQVLGTGGNINAKQLANDLGHGYARKVFTDTMLSNVLGPAGINTHARNVELLASELYKYVQVNGDVGDHIQGDIITIQEALPIIDEYSVELPLDKITPGQRLGQHVGDWLALDVISSEMLDNLRKDGVKKIKVFTKPELLQPIAKGMTSLPLLDSRDWVDNMAFRYLKKNISQALASGATQKIDRTSPISQYVTNEWD